ncbi:hypothetical protein HNW13_017530 [Shewanella sp. BF02_Schw]|uniref:hypothetical protein n=1 Tax=Shewanella sp. BF02_Schw TaxID=394908 RepID=UPI001787573B|nr:hypothetical protein [Shewanella sp. BF02_Schw]MBO1897541.1 hypothetical protein [Shewanella sp. BF02_Schw]
MTINTPTKIMIQRKLHLIEMFSNKAYRVDFSPLLENELDMFGEDGHSVYISWVEDNEGNEDSCTIPHSSLEMAELRGKVWFVLDKDGVEVGLKFYQLQEVF